MSKTLADIRSEQLAEQQIRLALKHLIDSGIEEHAAAHALLLTAFVVVVDARGFDYVESFARKWVEQEERERREVEQEKCVRTKNARKK